MLVIALCTACFLRAKINKKLWPPALNALAPVLIKTQYEKKMVITMKSLMELVLSLVVY